MKRLSDSAPGLDGLPYSAWVNGGETSLDYIIDLLNSMLAGEDVPKGVNFGLFVFIPKTDDGATLINNRRIVTPPPEDLRPLTLKAADNKTVAGVVNACITPVIKDHALKIQGGFVSGRQFLKNVVDLDCDMRVNALEYCDKNIYRELDSIKLSGRFFSNIPIGLLFDFASAFPSVRQAWLMLVLTVLKVPQGILNFVRALYKGNKAFLRSGGFEIFLFEVISGVLQGCPLSGSLFVILMDPLLFSFQHFVVSQGLGSVYACADDIGMSLIRASSISIIHKLFEEIRKASGLTLKPRKCIVIILVELSRAYEKGLSDWIGSIIPTWSQFKVQRYGKYLGFYLGPDAYEQMWIAPIHKFRERANLVASMSKSIGSDGAFFSSRVSSVLGYVAQLAPLPRGFINVERGALTKALRMVPNAFTTAAGFSMEQWGGPKIPRTAYICMSAMFRTALKTIDGYEDQHNLLCAKARDALPVSFSIRGDFKPPGWKHDAFCSNLRNAVRGESGELASARHDLVSLARDYRNGAFKDGVQSRACKIFHNHQKCDWYELLERRASSLCFNDEPSGIDWNALQPIACEFAVKLGKVRMLQTLKTWLNSWTTSSRLHDPALKGAINRCVFCCELRGDALPHYLRCEPLWTVLASCFKLRVEWISRSPAQRIGFVNPSMTSLLQVVVAFKAYHVLRQKDREGCSHPCPNERILCAIDLIRHFLTEIPRSLKAHCTGDVCTASV